MSVILRPAIRDDAPACVAILREWIDETTWFHTTKPPQADMHFMRRKIMRGEVTVAEEGEVLGFLALEEDYVNCLYIAAAARGRGVGAALMNHAKAQHDPLRLWTFQANTGAQAFYEREGFGENQRTDGEDNDEHLPDIEYVWSKGACP